MQTVLVVDDQQPNRVTLERILSREGWNVSHAEDGRQGLERLREGGVGVIVTDLKMPRMSGLELLKAARALAPDVEVVVRTACGAVEAAVEALSEGAGDCVPKPRRRPEIVASLT